MSTMAETKVEPITSDKVLTTLAEIAAEFGHDYIYKKPEGSVICVYEDDGKPSCLVGQVIARLAPGFKPDLTSVINQREAFEVAGFSRRAVLMLQMAQSVQDRGHPWGAAFAAAEGAYNLPYEFAGSE